MKVLLLVANRSSVTGLIPSFQEAFFQLHIDGEVFIVNEDEIYQKQRQELKKYIVGHRIDRLLCINDFCQNGEYLVDQEIAELTHCYIWFVDSMYSMKMPDPTLSLYEKVSSFEPKDTALSSVYHKTIHYVPLTMGNNIFCTAPENAEKKYDVSFVGLVSGSEQHFTTFTLPRKLTKLVYTRPALSPLDFLRIGL